ncbi:zinc protease PQQL-like protein [Arabidopsis thaliana]|uniref:Zinc protease PQQL-like n=1 Tax=Arabidopsis thaliana TaxID=3702 RepID=PQQL_ARATH|nr:RecName: Full=Zinc protease PQQL-like [Arabidopsis thaliana]BAB09891.1 zinc protease PQQL-like protein [Arabidopsis thaliana]
MDLIAGESSKVLRKQGFRSLKLMSVDMEQELGNELEPFGADYGRLDNGLIYYVRRNSKPRMRAALALAVKVGSVLEEEDQRGVAHIVEHLAFSATTRYTNHDIVKFLESIGAEFGPCQNAMTTADETIYELFVPVDKPELLSQAISILAEFSSEIRVSKEDLEKERGAVMEEYRGNRNATGRMQDSHWQLMMEGSKYAERLPIGLEKVIRSVPAATVKQFYQKWYHLCNMAVVAVGDFPDTKTVVDLIKTHFEDKRSSSEPPQIPVFPVPSHEETRFSCFVESEAAGSAVMISYKMPVSDLKTVKDYRDMLAESMFLHALNQRLFKISRRKDPPFFACSVAADVLVARVRLHGFSEREISVVRALMMSEIESAYLERDQVQSTSLRDEYIQHFLHKEPVIGIEYEAQLQKTLLPQISASDVSRYSEKLRTSCGCVIKSMEPKSAATIDHMRNVVSKVNSLEEEKMIAPWDEENIPEEIVSEKPTPGDITHQLEYPEVGVTELTLSNGMQVCYKSTDFLDDQVLFTGFSYGGLSELPESDYISCSMGSTIAGEIGMFGYKPSVLMDMLADLETALQLVYQLFTTNVMPQEEEVGIVMQMAEESVRARERDPYTVFANRVKELNYGNSYFFRPIRISELRKVDPLKACEYFNSCFRDPSTFTVVIVGNLDPTIALPLILQYLGGIPKPPQPVLNFNRDDLKGLPFTFPTKITKEFVRSPMVEAQCSVQLCFPVQLTNGTMIEEIHCIGFLGKLLETKIIQFLRFEHGQIYSAEVSVFLGGNKPSRTADLRGDISVNFSCDPEISSKLVDLALEEIVRLQKEGPSQEDISAILEIEQRAHENGMQENYYWLDRIIRGYQSRVYAGDLGASCKILEEGRLRMRESLAPQTAQAALQRILPHPCKKQYTAVILMPQRSRFGFLSSIFSSRSEGPYIRDTKILAGIAGLGVVVFGIWRYSRK